MVEGCHEAWQGAFVSSRENRQIGEIGLLVAITGHLIVVSVPFFCEEMLQWGLVHGINGPQARRPSKLTRYLGYPRCQREATAASAMLVVTTFS